MTLKITAADGYPLAATFYEGGDDAMVINSAMGVARRYYDAFARFMNEGGFSVLTFDYRGIGESRPPSLRGFPATLRDWGALDMTAAIGFMQQRKPRSITVVGHSAGGQLVPFAHNAKVIDRMVLVAAQSGYWRNWPGVRKYGLGALWMVMPTVARAAGYFPSRLFRLGPENLPREVASQWARWGRKPSYFFDEVAFDIAPPILAWSFEDDHYAPRPTVDALLAKYPTAPITRRHEPATGIKHFGFFRKQKGEALWRETLEWLER
ncbi:MAG TPA: alpha/beta fold hydrolase [Thermoanaerobaculia bacterium]|nr:alpha/beta fold hydrolase [Thermoanaerobaculia bacterium]